MSTDGDGFEELLRRGWEEGWAYWSPVKFSFEDFSRFVKGLLEGKTAEARREELQKLALKDLYLAGACLARVPGASERLLAYLKEHLPGRLQRIETRPSQLEELIHRLHIHLLVGPDDGIPRLKLYTGKGSLLSYCVTCVTRMAIHDRKAGSETLAGDVLETIGEIPDSKTPEGLLRKQSSLKAFRDAVHAALNRLSPRQMSLLWLYLCKRMSMTEVGEYCGMHQSSVSRALERTRQDIYAGTREYLQMSSSEFSSLLAEVGSQIDVGLSRFLRERFPSSDDSSSGSSSDSGPEARGA